VKALVTMSGDRLAIRQPLAGQPRFVCTACKRGADARPDFNWNNRVMSMMGYR
jgi:hypothetical protein